MAKFHHKQLKWLTTLSTEEAWKEIVKDATAGTKVDSENFLQKSSPYPILKSVRKFVGGWKTVYIARRTAKGTTRLAVRNIPGFRSNISYV